MPTGPNDRPQLIAGLGNPGNDYAGTRHNIGFDVLDELARRSAATFAHEKKWRADVAKCGEFHLVKPLTYMNLSGEAVTAVARFFKFSPSATLVVFDDAALPLGQLRIRPTGSAGSHNGMQSVIDHFGSNEIPRLRIGIGAPGSVLRSHVLGKFEACELDAVRETISRAADACQCAIRDGLAAAMNLFNQKKATQL